MMGAVAETVIDAGTDVGDSALVKPRRILSAADLELEFGSAIGELELGQGRLAGAATAAGEAAPVWSRLLRFFH